MSRTCNSTSLYHHLFLVLLLFWIPPSVHSPISAPIHSLSNVLPFPFLFIQRTDSVCSLVSLWAPQPRKHSTIFQPHVTDASGHGREIEALSWPQAITSRVDRGRSCWRDKRLSCPGEEGRGYALFSKRQIKTKTITKLQDLNCQFKVVNFT